MPVIDYGGQVVPWYEGVPIGAVNFNLQPRPANPSREELLLYYNGLRGQQEKMREGSGGFNDFMGNLQPINLALAAVSIALAPVTGGASLAIGEAILGAGAVGAATLGGAIVGSAISTVGAVATGGDVVKSAVTGAITGGAGANATQIGTAIAGGVDNVREIATALDLTTKQVTVAISNAVTTGVVTAAISDADVTTAITASLGGSIVGAYTTDLVNNLPNLKDAATLVGNVSSVATKATINGTDVGDALINNVGSIIGGYVADTAKTTTDIKNDVIKEITSTIEAGDTTDQSPGTQVTLADGSKGVVSNSGIIEPIDATTGMTTVGFKEPEGTVSLISDAVLSPDAIIQNGNSPTGFSDVSGNAINEDGTAYLDPNAVDVAPDNVNITTPTTDQAILNLINPVVARDDAVATDTTGATTTVDPTATTTTTTADTTGTTGTTGNVTDVTSTVDAVTGTETVPTKTDLIAEPVTVTEEQDPTVETTTVTQEEEVKPYTPFEEDFPLQTEKPKPISPTVIPKTPSQPSRSGKNATLSTGLGIDTNIASLLGTGLSSRPDVSSTSEPYLLGKDDKRKDVWNTESLRGALGI